MLNKILKSPLKISNVNQFTFIELGVVLLIFFHFIMFLLQFFKNDKTIDINLYSGHIYDNEYYAERIPMINKIKSVNFFEYKKKRMDEEVKPDGDIFNSPLYIGKIKLVGIIEHKNKYESMAVLDMDGKQMTYFMQDIIEPGGVIIVRIFTDRVIIEENKKNYSLVI